MSNRVLWSTTFEATAITGVFLASFLFNSLLYVLQTLNLMWFATVMRLVVEKVTTGQVNFARRFFIAVAVLSDVPSRKQLLL